MDIGFYRELRPSWPGFKALAFTTIWFLSHVNILPSLGSHLQLQNGEGHQLWMHPASPTASTLKAGDTMGTGVGHDLTGSARCSKSHSVVKQLPPQDIFQALTFKIIWMCFPFHHPLPKTSQCHFPSSQLPFFLFHHFTLSMRSLILCYFSNSPFPFHVSTSQPPRLCILWQQSSNYLTYLYTATSSGVCSFTKPEV